MKGGLSFVGEGAIKGGCLREGYSIIQSTHHHNPHNGCQLQGIITLFHIFYDDVMLLFQLLALYALVALIFVSVISAAASEACKDDPG